MLSLLERNLLRETRLKSLQKEFFNVDEKLILQTEKEFDFSKVLADRRNSQPVTPITSVKSLYSDENENITILKQRVLSKKIIDANSLIDGSEVESLAENQEICENEFAQPKRKSDEGYLTDVTKQREKITLLDKVKFLESKIGKLEEVFLSDKQKT